MELAVAVVTLGTSVRALAITMADFDGSVMDFERSWVDTKLIGLVIDFLIGVNMLAVAVMALAVAVRVLAVAVRVLTVAMSTLAMAMKMLAVFRMTLAKDKRTLSSSVVNLARSL